MKMSKKIFIYFIFLNLFFAAPLRFLFSFLLRADFLNYSLSTIFIILMLNKRQMIGAIIAKYSWLFVLVVLIALYSLTFENFKLVSFLFYELVPFFFFGLYYKETVEFINEDKWLFNVAFIFCAGGIIYDSFYDFPWKSLSYSFGGSDIDFAKDWTYNGVERVAGLARSSYDAAMDVLFLSVVILYKSRNNFINHLVFAITFVAIYITTTKGCLVTVVVEYVVYMTRLFNWKARKPLWTALFVFLAFLIVSLPLGILQDIHIPAIDNETLRIRIVETWPVITNRFDFFYQYVLGLGIGNVGLAQKLFGIVNLYSSADNFFIFLYSNFGLISFIIVYVGYKRVRQIDNFLFVYMLMFLFSYGITTNVIESSVGQLVILFSLFIPADALNAKNTIVAHEEEEYDATINDLDKQLN